MIRNYFISALRNFSRNKFFTLINVAGLAIGISASLVIFLIITFDFSYDKFQPDRDRIYRVVEKFTYSGNTGYSAGVPSPMGNAIAREATGIEVVSAFRSWGDPAKIAIPVAGGKPVIFRNQLNKVFVDSNYFRIIPYHWIIGSERTSLNNAMDVVLTESKAKLFFPGIPLTEIPGHQLVFNDTVTGTIKGIVEDLKERTDFTFKIFISRTTFETTSFRPDDWEQWDNINSDSQLFFKISESGSPAMVARLVNNLYDKNRSHDPEDKGTTEFSLQPLKDLHFDNRYDTFNQRQAHKPTLYGLIAVAIFLLLLACINYINLTTAQSATRAREIGVRKTLGSSRKNLIVQFLTETLLLTLGATLLSVLITPLLLKAFAGFVPEGLHFEPFQPVVIIFLLTLTLILSILSGLYPATVLSSYKTALVLKDQYRSGSGSGRVWLRKTLTISQFIIAQFFIIATISVTKQIQYSLNTDLGYRKDGIIYFTTNNAGINRNKGAILLEKLKAIPEIRMISMGFSNPSSGNMWTTGMKFHEGKTDFEGSVQVTLADTNFIKLYQIKLLAGNNLPLNDTVPAVLINETLARMMGFNEPQKAVGHIVEWNMSKTPVVGVLADFHHRSLHEAIRPQIVTNMFKFQHSTFNIALQPQNAEGTVWKRAISRIEKAFSEVYPDEDLDYSFVDQAIANYYVAERNISRLLMWATGLSIFISCLGLLGLVIFVTNQKTREIGIRKVLGADIPGLIALLSGSFMKLVLIAFIIVLPVSWYAMHRWLENFAYKTELSWWIFLAGGSLMMLISLIILVIRTYIAASANPVRSLRVE